MAEPDAAICCCFADSPCSRKAVGIIAFLLACAGFSVGLAAYICEKFIIKLGEGKISPRWLSFNWLRFGLGMAVSIFCLIFTFYEFYLRSRLDGATCEQWIWKIKCPCYPQVSEEIKRKAYGASMQICCITFASLHALGTILYTANIKVFDTSLAPLVFSTVLVVSKIVDFCSHEKVYINCNRSELRAIDTTRFRGSHKIDCQICNSGCPHVECTHCPRCAHCAPLERV